MTPVCSQTTKNEYDNACLKQKIKKILPLMIITLLLKFNLLINYLCYQLD